MRIAVGGGAVAFYRRTRPESVYVAFPRRDYQIEVYSPNLSQAHRLVAGGELKLVPGATAAPALEQGVPRAVTVADLKALGSSLVQPIYWVGPRARTTYELTRKGTNIFLRYLPRGVPVGAKQTALTVGTYRVPKAFAATDVAAASPKPSTNASTAPPANPSPASTSSPTATPPADRFGKPRRATPRPTRRPNAPSCSHACTGGSASSAPT